MQGPAAYSSASPSNRFNLDRTPTPGYQATRLDGRRKGREGSVLTTVPSTQEAPTVRGTWTLTSALSRGEWLPSRGLLSVASDPSWYFLLLMGRGSESLPGPLQSPVWWVSPFCSWRGKGRLDMSQGSWKPKSPLSSWPSCPPSWMHRGGTLKDGIPSREGTDRHLRSASFLRCQPLNARQQR